MWLQHIIKSKSLLLINTLPGEPENSEANKVIQARQLTALLEMAPLTREMLQQEGQTLLLIISRGLPLARALGSPGLGSPIFAKRGSLHLSYLPTQWWFCS